MITFGLTGGIACGKSTVSRMLMEHTIPIVDADVIARQVVEPGTPGLAAMVEAFGTQILQASGSLDRSALGEMVFADATARHTLDMLMAPLIAQESAKQFDRLRQEGEILVCFDGALIVETGSADLYRPLVVVVCPTETQIQRLIIRNGLTKTQAMSRIAAQMPNDEKVKLADFVIDTDCSLEDTKEQVIHLVDRLRLMV